MSTFAQLQPKRVRTAWPVRQSTPALRSSRGLEAPKVSPASETESSPDRQFTANFSLAHIPIVSPKTNQTGLPDDLKTRIESFAGFALDDVRIHYNSPEPARLEAWAYTQGTDIHVGPGQERHLPHEIWHVVQQKQGRVRPTMYVNGLAINDSQWLESEADRLGNRALARQFSYGALSRFAGESGQRPGYLVEATPLAKQGVVQCNGDGPPPSRWPSGLRRRKPAPARQREPEREYGGPPWRERMQAYIADIQNRPEYYANKGFIWSISFLLGQLGLNIPRALWGIFTGSRTLGGQFTRLIAYVRKGDTRNASAEATALFATIAGYIETAIGTEGAIGYATTGVVYGAGFAKKKEKTE